MVSCGAHHTLAVSEDGSLWSWGKGDDGALGLNSREHRLVPTRVGGIEVFGSRVVLSAAGSCKNGQSGSFHSGCVTEDGAVWTWGSGADGRLGHGDEEETRLVPTRLGKELFDGTPVVMLACGGTHTCALTIGGRVWTWGSGPLGHCDRERKLVPTLVPSQSFGGALIASVAAGVAHTLVCSTGGDVWTWGRGKYGRLGHGDEEDRLEAALIERLSPRNAGGCKVILLAGGFNHSVAVTSSGTLWSWGDGCSGRLGLGDRNPRLVPALVGGEDTFGSKVLTASCGSAHTLAATEEGILWSWGYGAGGRLGAKDTACRLVPTRLVRPQHFANARIIAIAAASMHSAVLAEDGSIWTWGPGELYAGAFKNIQVPTGLGLGDTTDKTMPTRVSIEGVRFGRCRRLPLNHVVAFAMATHKRLGHACVAFLNSDMPSEVLRRIIFAARSWPEGAAGKQEAVVRLIGGGLMQMSEQRIVDHTALFQPSPQLSDEMTVEDVDADEDEDADEEDDKDHGKRGKERGCRCGRTKCLKQYCQCFRHDLRCTPDCVCADCHNDGAHEEIRIEAIRRIRMTNFRAFKGTSLEIEDVSVMTASGSIKRIRGCRCRRSKCKKKYCECYSAALPCTLNCVCRGCENGNTAGVVKTVTQIMKTCLKSPENAVHSDYPSEIKGGSDDAGGANSKSYADVHHPLSQPSTSGMGNAVTVHPSAAISKAPRAAKTSSANKSTGSAQGSALNSVGAQMELSWKDSGSGDETANVAASILSTLTASTMSAKRKKTSSPENKRNKLSARSAMSETHQQSGFDATEQEANEGAIGALLQAAALLQADTAETAALCGDA